MAKNNGDAPRVFETAARECEAEIDDRPGVEALTKVMLDDPLTVMFGLWDAELAQDAENAEREAAVLKERKIDRDGRCGVGGNGTAIGGLTASLSVPTTHG